MKPVLKVAVPAPLLTTFDYLPPHPLPDFPLQPGIRVKVPFGRSTRIGMVIALESVSSIDPQKIRPILEVLDPEPMLRPTDVDLLCWAANYYHHPIGEVFATALPGLLRQGRPGHTRGSRQLRLTDKGQHASVPKRAFRQATLLSLLQKFDGMLTADRLAGLKWDWQAPARTLESKGILVIETASRAITPESPSPCFEINPAQRKAVERVSSRADKFGAFLLEGVTGSGKTEVYLGIIESVLALGRQVLVLFPEIALTPQLLARFRQRLNCPIGIYHSGLSDRERLQAWLGLQRGEIPILLGTRSAVFTPMAHPGMIVIDEEHDPAFKQQDGFRFSARDVAVVRARKLGIPIVLGSATPSLESQYNVRRGRYHHLPLPQRAGEAVLPRLRCVDIRNQTLKAGLAPITHATVQKTLSRGEQVLIFLNRRGFAPVLICHTCGWVAECPRCDARLVIHRSHNQLRCHHCGHQEILPTTCPTCHAEQLRPLGQGTERVSHELTALFHDVRIARIDRDTIRQKGSLEQVIRQIHQGEIDIVLGTQMLAKGHHFPNVTLAVILDADTGFYSTDFRASERMAQLITQVAGRAGRASKPGTVLIQTHHPDHPLLSVLLQEGYPAFARHALTERQQAQLPPFSHQTLLRAEAHYAEPPLQFLEAAAVLAGQLGSKQIRILGPVPAPMSRRAGRHRAQLLLQATTRPPLHRLLDCLLPRLEKLPQRRRIRWSVDVDPGDLY